MRFEHVTLGQRVMFGAGEATTYLASEVERREARAVVVVAAARERELAERVCERIDVAAWVEDVQQHVPVENADAARRVAAHAGADLIVSVGGGSTTGLAKAMALTTGIPVVAVPTTYAGSEATNVWGITEQRTKTTGVDDRVLPGTVIYDATLTTSLPVDLSVASGLNALAHCVDSLWAPRADPINQALSLEGARALAPALPGIVADPSDIGAREQALYGCYLAGVAFASAGSGLHHKICHVLGGTFDLPHAETHATVLPYVLALNAPAVPQLAGRLAHALGHPASGRTDPAVAALAALDQLRTQLDAPRRLSDYGLAEGDIPEAVRRVLEAAPPSNPAPVTDAAVTRLLTAALTGTSPTVEPSAGEPPAGRPDPRAQESSR